MMDFVVNFHFLRPYFLLFLIIPFLLYRKHINFRTGFSAWRQVCDKNLLDFLLIKEKKVQKTPLNLFMYLALVTATIAGAGPCWKKIETPTFVVENPVIFVLSLASDMDLKDITPSRLDRAKFAIIDIADAVKNGQFGIEVYTTEPYIISPITDDANLIKALIPQIENNIVPDRGDRLDRAIDLAIEKFKDSGFSSGNIILLSSDVGQRLDLALEYVEKAQRAGYDINVIDVSFLGNDKLELIAQKGNGVYVKIRDNDISVLIKKLSDISNNDSILSKNSKDKFADFGYYLIFIPLLCLLPFFRKGLIVAIVVLGFSFNAEAGFWLNKNQEGFNLYTQNKFDEAMQKFSDPFWKSIMLYKQDKTEEALKLIDKNTDEHSMYNKGVFLVKLCKYDEAKKVFENVVNLYPQNKMAKNNLDVLDALFAKAKEDPGVLECGEQNQNKNSQNQDSNKDNSESKNDNEDTKENKNSDNDKNNSDNKQNDGNNEKNDNEEQNNDSKDNQNMKNKEQSEQQNEKQNEEAKQIDEQKNKDLAENNTDKNNKKTDSNLEENKNSKSDKEDKHDNSDNADKQDKENKSDKDDDDNKTDNKNNPDNTDGSDKKQNEDNSSNNEDEANSGKENADATQQNSSDGEKNNDKQQDDENNKKDNNDDANQPQEATPRVNNKNQNGNKTTDVQELKESNNNEKEKGDKSAIGNVVNGEFNEEDLAIQRHYREIPEDIGGLLREFIKKEYAKDRYKNENY